MAEYNKKWANLFPATIGNQTRPSAGVDNTLQYETDKFPQHIANDPVRYDKMNAVVSQAMSNDERLKEMVDSRGEELDDHKVDSGAHKTGIAGNAGSATKLATARTIQTNLASTSAASFNGTTNIAPGVTGTLPVGNGGTGQTNLDNVTVGTAKKVHTTVSSGTVGELIKAKMGNDDSFRIAVGGSANNGWAELATADDGTEPIYVRQYADAKTDGFVTPTRTATLLDAVGNTSFPGTVTAPTFSGSLNGNANTAAKLQTARTISLTGDITGSATFDGSSNMSINVSKPYVVGEIKRYTVDLSTLDTTKFYPIIFSPDDIILRCEIHSTSLVGESPYNQNTISFRLLGRGWSDAKHSFSIDEYEVYEDNEITIGCIGSGTQAGYDCVWVRGGLQYRIVSNRKPVLYTKDITFTGDGTETYTVGTNYYGGTGNNNVNIIFTPQVTIKKGPWHDGMTYGNFEQALKDASGNVITDTYVTKTGGGASGTWNINISGNAASAKTADGLSGDLVFPGIGDTNVSRKITWAGSTDSVDIYYQTTEHDQGNLVFNLRDDENCYLRIAANGAFKSYFSPDGVFHGNATNATDADTVDGYHASDLLRILGGNRTPVITDIFDRAGTIDMSTMSAADKATHKANINKASNGIQNIWNNGTGVHAYGGDIGMSGYSRGTLKLTQSWRNFDKLMILYTDDDGEWERVRTFDVYEFNYCMTNMHSFNILLEDSHSWHVYGLTKHGTDSDFKPSTETVLSCRSQNCGIIGIYGIKF